MYDILILAPLIIYIPEKKEQKIMVADKMGLNIEISPGILRYTGIKIPELI